jgi:hypothetical protein
VVTPPPESPSLHLLRLGEILRFARPKSIEPAWHGPHKNLFAATRFGTSAYTIPFDSGINAMRAVNAPEGRRVPAILVTSSPHKVGSDETPWQDIFDADNGFIRYFGDNREAMKDPATKRGNRALLAALETHQSPEVAVRRRAIPIIFFRRTTVGGVVKGFVRFEGFGAIRRAERVVQARAQPGTSFANYVFEFLVMDLGSQDEAFDWSWINARRDPSQTLEETLELSPKPWRTWINGGDATTESIRRRVSKLLVRHREEQRPADPMTTQLLSTVYELYKERRYDFEAIAAWAVARILEQAGAYRHEGITRRSGDGGFDFLGRLDIGQGFGKLRLVVLGQAKCEAPNSPTSGRDVARTVARLRRGWIGTYVTTSFFSEPTQREVIEDRYPILLINGRKLAEVLATALHEQGDGDLPALLETIETKFLKSTDLRDPDQLLFND